MRKILDELAVPIESTKEMPTEGTLR